MRDVKHKFKKLMEKDGTLVWEEFLEKATEKGIVHRIVARNCFRTAIVNKLSYNPKIEIDIGRMSDLDMNIVFTSLRQWKIIDEETPDKITFVGSKEDQIRNAESLIRMGAFLTNEEKFFPPNKDCRSTKFKPGEVTHILEVSRKRRMTFGTRDMKNYKRTLSKIYLDEDEKNSLKRMEGRENELVYLIGVSDD